jgi:hypothetical protein
MQQHRPSILQRPKCKMTRTGEENLDKESRLEEVSRCAVLHGRPWTALLQVTGCGYVLKQVQYARRNVSAPVLSVIRCTRIGS